jgi:hypothetical protein
MGLTGLTLGYGYQPRRALIFLLAVVAMYVGLALYLGGAKGRLALTSSTPSTTGTTAAQSSPTKPCSTVLQVGVGLDLGLPLVKTAADTCKRTDTPAGDVLTVASWVLQALAWIFATLFIAGFTGAVRKT